MPVITFITCVTIATQMGASGFNYARNKKMQKRLQLMVQDMERRIHEENATFSRNEMTRLFMASRELEEDMHQSRLYTATKNINTEVELSAYASSLENWPLLVPPYVMKDNSLTLNETVHTNQAKIALHCIIAPSMNPLFDKKILPTIEDKVASFFKRHFSTSTDHPVIFYQNAWKNEMADASALVKDLHAHTSGLPVLIVSPRFNNEGKLYFLFSFWGLGNNEEGQSSAFINARFIPNGISRTFEEQPTYTKEKVDEITAEITPALEGFIGFVADNFFWTYDKVAPVTPSLLASGDLLLTEEMRQECEQGYQNAYDLFMGQETNIILHPNTALSLIKSTHNKKVCEMANELWKKMATLRGFNNDLLNPALYTFSDDDRLFLQRIKHMRPTVATEQQIEQLLKEIDLDAQINAIPVGDIYY